MAGRCCLVTTLRCADMKIINISLKSNPYKIYIGSRILTKLIPVLKKMALGKDAVVITNRLIYQRHGTALVAGLRKGGFGVRFFEVADSEKSKSAAAAFRLLQQIARHDIGKKIFIIAFGGGVIGDLAGFVAAVYKRGIPYVQIPTTLLAQIDSAIGGKTAIDLPVGKNLAGAFYQPRLVWSDVSLLQTLPGRQLKNGLAEAVKYGVIRDKSLFDYLSKHHKLILSGDSRCLQEVVFRCSRIKADVVAADEKETKGIRTILNFGHTIGHAVEAAGRFSLYQHGEAIALGMRVAADIAGQMKLFPGKDAFSLNQLLTQIGLPARIKKLKTDDILKTMRHEIG